MRCPKCGAALEADVAAVVDTTDGILAVLDHPTTTRRAWCPCGWTYRITSTTTTTRQPELALVQGDAA